MIKNTRVIGYCTVLRTMPAADTPADAAPSAGIFRGGGMTCLLLAALMMLTFAVVVGTASAADVYVDESGWWHDGGALHANDMPIRAAVDNADAGEIIFGWNGSYTENVDANKRITLVGEGADVVAVTATTSNSSVESAQSSIPINFGETTSSSIDFPDEMDTYTFSANSGDTVLIRMSKVSGSLRSMIRLYAPDGTELDRCHGSSNAEISYTLAEDGEYTVLAYDYWGDYTGNYTIFVQRINNPGNTIPVGFGEVISGSIDSVGGADTYTFYANTSDTVLLRINRSSIRLYAPNGTELTRGAEISYSLPDDGMYATIAGFYAGSYNMFTQRLNNPMNATPVGFGETISGSIDFADEMDTYTFSANSGDTVLIRMSEVSGSLRHTIRLYAPDGTELDRGHGSSNAEISYTLVLLCHIDFSRWIDSTHRH